MSADQRTWELLAEALSLPANQIDETTDIETCPNWDSLAHFRIVAGIEAAIGRQLDPIEIAELSGYQSVRALIG